MNDRPFFFAFLLVHLFSSPLTDFSVPMATSDIMVTSDIMDTSDIMVTSDITVTSDNTVASNSMPLYTIGVVVAILTYII